MKNNNDLYLLIQKNKFLLLAIVPAVVFYSFFLKYGVNAPFADDISAVNALVIRFYYGNESWWDKILLLFAQCNEHRIFFSSLVSVVQFGILGQIDFLMLDFIGGLSCFGILMIFQKIILKYQYPTWIIVPVSFTLFNLTYFQNIFWTVCALQHNSLPFFVLWLFLVLSGNPSFTRFVFSLSIAFLAVFTSANGFLVFIAALPLMLKYSKKYLIYWGFAGLGLFLLYMSNYEHPFQRGSLLENIFKIKEILFAFFVYLGSFSSAFFYSFTSNRVLISFIAGLVSFCIIVSIYWHNRSKLLEKDNIFIQLSAIFLFLFATIGLYSLARANDSIESVFESRYGINSTIYLIAFILLFLKSRPIGRLFKWSTIAFSILYFASSFVTRFVSVANFSNELTAGVFTNKSLKRVSYYYLDSTGSKVDLVAPTVQSLSQLPRPIVNITAQLPSSIKYFSDVIFLSNSYKGFQPFNENFSKIYHSFEREKKVVGIPSFRKNNILHFWPVKNGFRYSGRGISARISNGSDGVYAVLFDKGNKKWVFNLFWSELNRRKQLMNWDAIYVRNLEGIIPFKYLPDGKYSIKIFKIQNEKIELVGLSENLIVKGI